MIAYRDIVVAVSAIRTTGVVSLRLSATAKKYELGLRIGVAI